MNKRANISPLFYAYNGLLGGDCVSYKHAKKLYMNQFKSKFPEELYNMDDVNKVEIIRQCLSLNCEAEILFPFYF